ncbi:MAG: hypothetical protein ACXWML_04950, partial [Candidatus Binataceae bacterium]
MLAQFVAWWPTAPPSQGETRMITAWLSIMNAILAVLLLLVGIGGAHLSLLPSVCGADSAMVGFYLTLFSFLFAALALLIGLLGIARTAAPERRVGRPKAVAGLVLGLLVAVPVGFTMWRWISMPYPAINDITTDYENPPEFVKSLNLSPDS